MKIKRLITALLAVLLAGTVTACAGEAGQAASSTNATSSTSAAGATRTVEDGNGNPVEIPAQVTRVAPAIGAFAELTQIVAGDQPVITAAQDAQINGAFRKFLPAYEKSNPKGYAVDNVEDLVASGTQVVFGPESVISADQQAQLKAAGISFVPINKMGTVKDLANAAIIIGNILGGQAPERAQQFADYWKGQLDQATKATASLTDRQSIMVVAYQEGAYATTNKSDISQEYFEAAGLTNAAADIPGSGKTVSINTEKIVQLNPDWILASDPASKKAVEADPALSQLDVVRAGHVLVTPYGAYLWRVRSGEGALMPMWLVAEIYPEAVGSYDKIAAVKDFWERWYGYTLSDDEAAQIFVGQQVKQAAK